MGNWRTVNIQGTLSADDAARLREVLDRSLPRREGVIWRSEYACLSFSSTHPGLAGLGDWPAEQMNRFGNLAERDYSVEDVAEALKALVQVAPTMLLKVHCGGDWESGTCVATVSVGEGLVVVGKPEQETVEGAPDDQMRTHFLTNLMRPAP